MSQLIDEIKDLLYSEIDKKENKDNLKCKVLDPCVKYIGDKLWPYICFTMLIIIFLLITLFYTIYIVSKVNK